jgi:YidC/Oxa1 family membrane protein insertase
VLDPLYHLAAHAIVFFHKGFGPIFGKTSFYSWAFSVVLIVVCVRIVIFPLFVKQIKSQRQMQMMQPLFKELKEKYAHDKKLYQQKVMELQKEHGNPMFGCLTIFLQIPLFIALFHVFNSLHPVQDGAGHYHWVPKVGLTADQVQQIASAKLWGVSLSTAFTSKSSIVNFLHADSAHIKIFAVVLIVLMSLTTFLTQRQIIGRAGNVDPQQQMVQKVMLWGSPVFLAIFGFRFPIAVLFYWLTTNLWSMGQQFFVIRRMPPIPQLTPSGKIPGARPDGPATGVSKPAPGQRPGGKGSARTAAGGASAATPSGSGASTGRVSRAPAGTSSRSGTAAKGGAAKGGAAAASNGNGSRPDLKKPGSGAGSGAGSAAGSGAAGGTPSNGRVPPAGDGTPRPPSVRAGARRPPGGSRPAKKRGKGQRRGGRG